MSSASTPSGSVVDSFRGDTKPELKYALISRGPKVVLAEYTAQTGYFPQAAGKFLELLDASVPCKSYVGGEYMFHYIIDDSTGIWFVCIADRNMGRRLPFAFLDALHTRFFEPHRGGYTKEQAQAADAYQLHEQFKVHMKELIDGYNSPSADRMARVKEEIKHRTDELMENIELILERQDHIDEIVTQTEQLTNASFQFHRDARVMARTMWWRNARTVVILVLIVVLVIFGIVWASCGITFEHCRSSGDDNNHQSS